MQVFQFRLLSGKHYMRVGKDRILKMFRTGDVVEFNQNNMPLPQDIGLGRKWEQLTPTGNG